MANDPKKYILSVARKLAAKKARVEIVGVKYAEGVVKRRIFNKGLDSRGQKIGSYSTKPGYFERSAFAKPSAFKPTGKNAKVGKSGVGKRQNFVRQTDTLSVRRFGMYLSEGYSQLRKIQGFQNETVDLDYTGSLRLSVTLNTRDGRPELGIYNSEEVKKANKLEEHFKGATGTIFSPSKDERSGTLQAMQNEFRLLMREIL